MGVAVPAVVKSVMGNGTDIFRVQLIAGQVETNLVKRSCVAYAFLHQHRLCT